MNWNPTFRLIRYPVAFLVSVLLLVACGSDEGSSADPDPNSTETSTETSAETSSTETTAAPTTEAPTTTAPTTTTTSTDAESSTTTAAEAVDENPAGQGIVTVRLQEIDGFFIEGFEIGLRFETAARDVIGATLWTDFVNSTGNTGIEAYYDSVLEQSVPAGTITVLATANVGTGPGPVIPDPNGPLDCRLTVEVPAGGQVDVEVGFDGENCLRQL